MALSYTESDRGFRATEGSKVFWAIRPFENPKAGSPSKWTAHVSVEEANAQEPERTTLRRVASQNNLSDEAAAKAWLETQR